jgi:hypothetical protein
MGWICVTSGTCEVINNVWNQKGIAYFSISDEVGIYHDIFFNFMVHQLKTSFGLFMIIFVFLVIFALLISVRLAIRKHIAN